MSTATDTKITYRKTKAGDWVAYGRLSSFDDGNGYSLSTVAVSKKDGTTKTEQVHHLGKPFTVGGIEMVYAYLVAAAAPRRSSPSRSSCDGDCWSFGTKCWSCGS